MTFCCICPVERLFQVYSKNQPAYWDSICLVPLFRGRIILVKSLSVLIAHCPEIFWEEGLSDSLRNAPLKSFVGLYKISHHITVVFCVMISQKKIGSEIFEWFSY